ncbi:MAG: hypothetical protein FJ102_14440 [Deltaproteobacteria bacterium]|nr:hypothetical protein [Deltaproteobacteria bacterium]
MGKYAFIDRIFGDTDDEETEANDALYDEDDEPEDAEAEDDDEAEDEDGGDDDGDGDDLPVEDEAMLAQLDRDFRRLRARVRGSDDLSDLRSIRAEQTDALTGPLTPTVRLRTLDIIEAIDDRVTDLRARRGRSD